MLKNLWNKILIRLIFILTIVMSVIILSSVLLFNYTNSNRLLADYEKNISSYMDIVSKAYIFPIYNLDDQSIEKLNEAIMENPNICAINVYEDGSFIMGGERVADKFIRLRTPYSTNTDNVVIKKYSTPIINDSMELGMVEVFFTTKNVLAEISAIKQRMLIMMVFLGLFSLLMLYFILKNAFIRPVLKLAEISHQVTETTDYQITLEYNHHDELGKLYDGFNSLLKKVSHREADLKETRSYLNNIIESMPSILITLDENNFVTQWNRSAINFTGISSENIIGKKLTEVTDIFDKYLESKKELLKSNKPRYFYKQQFELYPDRVSTVSIYPLVANGVRGIVMRIDDITEMDKVELELRQIQKMETIGTLVGGLAHDFNNVLGGIIGIVSLMKTKLYLDNHIPNDDLVEYLNLMEESGERATDMVQQLLTLSRKQDISFAPVDLNQALKHVMKICNNTFDKCVDFNVVFSGEYPTIYADPTQIEQVILNLLVNAYHSMTLMRKPGEPQGGTISAFVEKVNADPIFCSTHPESEVKDYWKLSISDKGVGMSDSIKDKIFEPFFSTKEKGQGTGLGLAMVYNIAKSYHGFIDVYTEEGQGSTFNLFFPVYHRDEDELIKSTQVKYFTSGKGTVLVIDDEMVMREIAKLMLEQCGYNVILADNGATGLELYKQHKADIDLIVLDMVMPVMSGIDAFYELKAVDPEVKILLVSGFKQDARVKKLIEEGVNGFIQKPYTMEKLSKHISEILDV